MHNEVIIYYPAVRSMYARFDRKTVKLNWTYSYMLVMSAIRIIFDGQR